MSSHKRNERHSAKDEGMRTRRGIGGHQSARMKSCQWFTPPEIIQALGSFDLDPCAAPDACRHIAKRNYTKLGLIQDWSGRVWLNPPYGREATGWIKKLSEHGHGIAILFARTETQMFFDWVWSKADALLFIKGRLHFYDQNGRRAKANSGAPSVLIAYGNDNARCLRDCKIPGAFVRLRE